MPVKVWRASERPGIVLMHGVTDSHAVEPSGEYFIGVIARRRVRVTRGGERHVLRPGELAVWDPTRAHSGAPADGGPWECRLMMIEPPDLAALAGDPAGSMPDLEFPDPVLRAPGLARGFLELHRATERSSWALQRETLLAAWLQRLARLAPRPPRDADARAVARDDPALRRACEFLSDHVAENVTLDQLAAAAEVSKFRLVRLFTAGLGLPPHRFQLAQRLRLARRLLEKGHGIAETALATGFYDQSHLHRHFRRTLGMTPRAYTSGVTRA